MIKLLFESGVYNEGIFMEIDLNLLPRRDGIDHERFHDARSRLLCEKAITPRLAGNEDKSLTERWLRGGGMLFDQDSGRKTQFIICSLGHTDASPIVLEVYRGRLILSEVGTLIARRNLVALKDFEALVEKDTYGVRVAGDLSEALTETIFGLCSADLLIVADSFLQATGRRDNAVIQIQRSLAGTTCQLTGGAIPRGMPLLQLDDAVLPAWSKTPASIRLSLTAFYDLIWLTIGSPSLPLGLSMTRAGVTPSMWAALHLARRFGGPIVTWRDINGACQTIEERREDLARLFTRIQ